MDLKLMIFTPPYNKEKFYQLMGAFFGERRYRNQLPYLINSPTTTWYLLVNEENQVQGFVSYEQKGAKAEIGDFYLSDTLEEGKYKRYLLRQVLKDIRKDLSIEVTEVASKCPTEKILFEDKGFELFRQTKNYYFLKREELSFD